MSAVSHQQWSIFVFLAFRSNLKRDGYEYLFVDTVLTVMLLQTDPIEYVEDICENMQLFPKEDFLTGDQLMFEFKPEVVAITCSTDFDVLQVLKNMGAHLCENTWIFIYFFLLGDLCCTKPPHTREGQLAPFVSRAWRPVPTQGKVVWDPVQSRGFVHFILFSVKKIQYSGSEVKNWCLRICVRISLLWK